VLYAAFVARNRIESGVLPKTTKVKNNFINGKNKFKSILSCLFFLWKAKSSSYEFALEDFISVVGSAVNSVGTTFEFPAFRSGPDAKYSRASAFCFFLSATVVVAVVRTHFLRKNTSIFMSIGILSRVKK